MIRLGRRRRPRVHIIEQHVARRAVRDASCSTGREHSLTPVLVLTRARPGGHHERHPLAELEWPPTYAEGHSRNIHRCARFARPAPWVFRSTPGGGFAGPLGMEHPQGCLQAPPGVVVKPLRVWKHPPGTCSTSPGDASCQDARLTMSDTLYVRGPTSRETGRSFRR